MKTKKMYHFHVGRGGRFSSPGYVRYVEDGLFDEAKITRLLDLDLLERYPNGRFAYVYRDNVGSEIITVKELREGLKKGRVIIDLDGNYDTHIFTIHDNILKCASLNFQRKR